MYFLDSIVQLFTSAKMEPRFSLPDSTPRSSKRELVIGGVKTYIYGLDELKRNLREAIEGYLLVAQDAAGSEEGELLDLAL